MTADKNVNDFEPRLRAYAEVIVRTGLNLQRGQRLLIAEPYDLQGVDRSAASIVEAVREAASIAAGPNTAASEIIWGDAPRLREYAAKSQWRAFAQLVAANADRMEKHIQRGDALLFLPGSQPTLLADIPAARVAELRRIGWEYFGAIAQQLVAGATNWTAAPAPSPAWAQTVFSDQPADQQLAALWESVFAACRISTENDPLAAWQAHLLALQKRRDEMNARRLTSLRYVGEGTDLTVILPAEHVWCTAQLSTKAGLPFVANLPTEEVFTTPHRDSANGMVRVARPVNYGGAVIDGIELEFRQGRVIRSAARVGNDLLAQMLATDEGAARLGEVALVLRDTTHASSDRLFHQALLDENLSHHIALGNSYDFCLRSPNHRAANRSLIHVDLSLDAQVSSPGTNLS